MNKILEYFTKNVDLPHSLFNLVFSNNNTKLKFLECYRSSPLDINLVPRFEETREKDKVDRRSCFETFDER